MSSLQKKSRALCLGYGGGVGQALCALLAHHPKLLERAPQELLLLDAQEDPGGIRPAQSQVLPHQQLDRESLFALLREYRIDQLIDCSTMDTVGNLAAAAEAGADYLSTSIAATDIPTHRAVQQLFAEAPKTHQSLLAASGMNPGIVNALTFAAMEALASRVGTAATPEALELQSLLVTEKDSTHSANGFERVPPVFALSWGPATALEELTEPQAVCWRNGVSPMEHPPWGALYRARCGPETIEGLLVPHEEVFTLGARLGLAESAFIYRLPDAAQALLRQKPRHRSEWDLHRLGPPYHTDLHGSDRVGVLLVSSRFGELWMGFDTPVAAGLAIGTNATLLQVAAGIIAGWNQLGDVPGLHVPEDLDRTAYLRTIASVLGSAEIIHDPTKIPLRLAERRVPEPAAVNRTRV